MGTDVVQPAAALVGPLQGRHQFICNSQKEVCSRWKVGRCNKFPCPFSHPTESAKHDNPRKNFNNTWRRTTTTAGAQKLCNFWVNNSCRYGNTCRFLHSWTTGNCGFTMLKQLDQGGVVMGIALPSGSDKLYTASKDKTFRLWDCNSGECAGVFNFDEGEVGCMISKGPWVFVGLRNVVKAYNTQASEGSCALVSFNTGPVGQVCALVVCGDDSLFGGTDDGVILAWNCNTSFEPFASLRGHTHRVVSMTVGLGNKLYSGSMDNSIRVWSLESLECLQILTDHKSVVMSLLCWDRFLISSSLDKTIKVWEANNDTLELTYTHNLEEETGGVLALCGINDSEGKPVLFCSCNDNTVRIYDIPSFAERGKILSSEAVRCIEIGPGGLFFTGDESGQVRVWQWLTTTTTTTA